jgi:hypothetical protein
LKEAPVSADHRSALSSSRSERVRRTRYASRQKSGQWQLKTSCQRLHDNEIYQSPYRHRRCAATKGEELELRAALSLAKLYQSTDRVADAHAVLAPALEGFAPTPDFPEIAEAQALVDTLAKDDRVREALGKQQQM